MDTLLEPKEYTFYQDLKLELLLIYVLRTMISFFMEWLLGTLEVDLKPMVMADKDTNSIVPLLNRIRSD